MAEKNHISQEALFQVSKPAHEVGDNEKTVIELLQELDAAGILQGVYRAKGNILISIARAVDQGLGEYKISVATSNLVKQLYEGLAEMPEPPRENSADSYDTLRQLIEYMTEQAVKKPESDSDYEPSY